MESHCQSVIKNRLIIQTVANSFIENSPQNRNQDSNVAYDIASTRNNNINDVIINITEECINIQLPRIQKVITGC